VNITPQRLARLGFTTNPVTKDATTPTVSHVNGRLSSTLYYRRVARDNMRKERQSGVVEGSTVASDGRCISNVGRTGGVTKIWMWRHGEFLKIKVAGGWLSAVDWIWFRRLFSLGLRLWRSPTVRDPGVNYSAFQW
jgi:hypothetical protein